MQNFIQMTIFVLQIIALYVMWVTKKTIEKYMNVRRGTYFSQKETKSRNNDDFYKEYYQKTETRNMQGQSFGNNSSGPKKITFEDKLIRRGVKLEDYRNSMKLFNIEELPLDSSELKGIYREGAKKYHPDAGGSEADFNNFQHLYKTLEKVNEIKLEK